MAVKEVDDPSLYGVVVHDDDMRVVGFQEKPPREEALSTLCNCGIYAFEPRIFDYIEPGAFTDWAKDVFPALLRGRAAVPLLGARELLERRRQHRAVPPEQLRRPAGPRGARRPRPPDRAARVGRSGHRDRGRRPSGAADPARRRLPHRVRRRAHRPAHHRRRLRGRARRRARGRHPVGRRQGRARLATRRQHPRAATWSCITRRSFARTRSSATARRSRRTRSSTPGARLEPRTRVGAAGGPRIGGDGVSAVPRVHAGGALDGLLDLVFPGAASSAARRAPGSARRAPQDLRPLPDDRCRRCGAPLRRAGRPARPCAPAPPSRACPPAASAPAATSPSPPPRRRSATRGRRGRWSPPASSARCARSPTTSRRARRRRSRPSPLGPAPSAVVTSVPAHRDHRLERGFDLAESFARRLARDAGLTYAPLLRRVRHGARQSGLDRASRAANVHHAFALRDGGFGVGNRLKRVIIIDDVYTTGETLNQCAEALAQAALDPLVFTFARTVRATPAPASRDHAVPKERCR